MDADYTRQMTEKKQTSAEYWKARDEVKEYLIIQEKIASMRRDERKMKLIGSGSRNRRVKNTGPGICENAGAPGFFYYNNHIGIFDF